MTYSGKGRTEQPSDLRQTRPLFNDRDLNFSIGELSAIILQFWDDAIEAVDWGEKGFTLHGPRGSVELDYTVERILLAAALVQISDKVRAEVDELNLLGKSL
ncbi:MAG: hypothetical protein ACFFB3_03500 [Candidatus Hodarchaeota archaeon]